MGHTLIDINFIIESNADIHFYQTLVLALRPKDIPFTLTFTF